MTNLLLTVLKSISFFMGWALLVGFIPDISLHNPAFLRLWYELVPFIQVVIFTLIFVIIVEKRQITVSLFKNSYRNTMIGLITGSVWLGSTVAILFWIGSIYFEGIQSVPYLGVWILASLFNVAMQELLMRGYLYQLYKKKYSVVVATIITTTLFTAMHGGAFEAGLIPVLNVITMSLFMTGLLEYTQTLLAPILAHFIWNTMGGIFLGGVTLAEDYPHILNSSFIGNSVLSGGIYKVEGSIVVLILNVLASIILLILINQKSKKLV